MFFDVFSDLCKQKGISCKKAAEDIGLSNSITTKWKKTKALPDSSTILRIASYFGVTTDFLLGHNLLGTYLRHRRGTQNMQDFAAACGISLAQLENLESPIGNGAVERSPSSESIILGTDDLRTLSKALNVDFNYLACLYDGKNPHSIEGVHIPDDDITAFPYDLSVLRLFLDAKQDNQISEEDQELLALFEQADPEKKAAIRALLK